MTKHQMLIIGAGTAGITVAAQLLKAGKNFDIAIIDPAEKHYYQPAWTLVGAGTFNLKKTERSMASVIPTRVKWYKHEVTELDPDNNTVSLNNGEKIVYEYLIACPGIQINPDGIEGLSETLGKNNVSSVYMNPEYTWKVLQEFKGGTALFTQPATAIKCGGAPQKIMYLAEDYFRKSNVKDKTDIVFATPGSVIFGIKDFAETLMKVVDRKNITLKFFHKLVKIDGPNKKAHYEITVPVDGEKTIEYNPNQNIGEEYVSKQEVVIPFDMLHLAPPQSAPDFVRNSKLAGSEGPANGWLDVDQFTLQHKRYGNVFGLGDAAGLPTAKTGAAVRKQAPVVVQNLLDVMDGKDLDSDYSGYSSCPLVTGYGKMVLAEFKYNNVRDSDPFLSKFIDPTKENYSMWLLKKYGLPFMYWNLMLKGKM